MGAYPDPSVYSLNVALLGYGLEPYDPITTAAHVLKDNLPGVPAKNILIWYAIGDSLVTNIATEMVARTMGIDLLGPARSEEHTSELQSLAYLVCRLLLEKKKN